jgi:hypothetical protein
VVLVTLQRDAVRRAWLAAGWLGVGLVVFLSLTPTPPQVDLGAYTDKWEHATAYALLMWWFCQVQTSLSMRGATGLGLVALGIALEFAQRATQIRMFELSDMVAGALGVALGWLLAPPRMPNLLYWCERRLAAPADNPRGD